MEYTLRNLKADDIFYVLRIINKIGVKEVKNCFNAVEVKQAITKMQEDGENSDMAAVGMSVALELASLIVSHLPDCQNDLYAFLASLSGMKVEEIADLPMNTFVKMVSDVVRKQEFKDFFTDVIALFK